jgi:hypothetical protein
MREAMEAMKEFLNKIPAKKKTRVELVAWRIK